ncbi:RNA polymerase, Rpb8 [Dillenia turbinata]|uniref:RNA polymerase, Rpb8 n=1 Tax=Dillenia turbinata TaxID=194707 RepID=A0AAN8VD43_9MAGN
MLEILFEDIFMVGLQDPDGKKFDKGVVLYLMMGLSHLFTIFMDLGWGVGLSQNEQLQSMLVLLTLFQFSLPMSWVFTKHWVNLFVPLETSAALEDIGTVVNRVDARNEQFDMQLVQDVNTEIYPICVGEKFTMILTPTLNLDGTPDTDYHTQIWERSMVFGASRRALTKGSAKNFFRASLRISFSLEGMKPSNVVRSGVLALAGFTESGSPLHFRLTVEDVAGLKYMTRRIK